MEASPRVLLVDDDPSLRMLCRVNLELEGFEVQEAANVADAESAVAAARPDVVLLDVHLGGEDSNELLVRLRSAGIPTALVTGSVDIAEYASRADAILPKPFLPTKLVEVARQLAGVGPVRSQ